jgi:hypothetical protein
MSSAALVGNEICNGNGEKLGDIKDIVLDIADQTWAKEIRTHYLDLSRPRRNPVRDRSPEQTVDRRLLGRIEFPARTARN